MKDILITYAVAEEFRPIEIENCNIRYVLTGVGKTHSTLRLTLAILEHRPDCVINIGTAGTTRHRVGDIFICSQFVDRDYQRTQLPGIQYELSTRELLESHNELKQWLTPPERTGICSTGDTFVTDNCSPSEDVVDMEAYSQALVCTEFNLPFLSVKYITDIIGQNSVKHWEDKLADACEALTTFVKQKLTK